MTEKIPVKEKAPQSSVAQSEEKKEAVTKQTSTLRLTPRTDVLETKESFLILLDMPGVGPGDVSVHFEEGVITAGGKCHGPDCGDRKPLYRAFDIKEYYRSFQLPDGVDFNKIEAKMQDGVLTVALPKAEDARPRQIPVNVK